MVIGDHFGGGDHFDGGDHFGGGTGKHGLFWSRSVQNADYRLLLTIVFTTQLERDKNSPTDCFLTLKTMVCIKSALCSLHFVLSSFGMDWYISQEMCA